MKRLPKCWQPSICSRCETGTPRSYQPTGLEIVPTPSVNVSGNWLRPMDRRPTSRRGELAVAARRDRSAPASAGPELELRA